MTAIVLFALCLPAAVLFGIALGGALGRRAGYDDGYADAAAQHEPELASDRDAAFRAGVASERARRAAVISARLASLFEKEDES